MSAHDNFDVVVGYEETHSPTTSISSSPASSTASSCGSSRMSRNSRLLVSTRKFVPVAYRRPLRKLTVGKRRSQKDSYKMAKVQLLKKRVMKEQKRRVVESKQRIEELNRRRQELHAGNSDIAILCEEVTTAAREVRAAYDRQRPLLYQNLMLQVLEQQDEMEGGYSYSY